MTTPDPDTIHEHKWVRLGQLLAAIYRRCRCGEVRYDIID